ncbi:MAG: hypothetical protein QOK40_1222 [Miltoncostaeaceae bacterium]|jgi:hypothetical protein|nr:hypothetical protein [Miltoncostaeaceae bacterium]
MKGFRTKKVTLPGGKVLEIVYFHEAAEDETASSTAAVQDLPQHYSAVVDDVDAEAEYAATTAEPTDLHVCPECAADLVYPVEWEEHKGDRWRLSRRCPSCEWSGTGEFDQDSVDRFDDVLSEGTEALLTNLRSMVRANMEEDVERMIAAINADLILPIDF